MLTEIRLDEAQLTWLANLAGGRGPAAGRTVRR
jgi:hypothetical protein